MPDQITSLDLLCLHTITTRPWDIDMAADKYAERGIKGITVWREALEGHDPYRMGKHLTDQGLEVVSLCRGGFLPSTSSEKRDNAIDENLRAIDEAAALGAPMLVLVCGADPGQSLELSRGQIVDGIAALLPHAIGNKVKLTIEPLHPMYADSRSAINTLKQANDLCEQLNSPGLGVAVDVYHLWWDPELEAQIERCGEGDWLDAFHISDWRTPTTDLLLDREIMGRGCIPIRQIRGWVEAAGFNGFNEVEIFSNQHWSGDQNEYLDSIITAYKDHC